MVLESLTSPFSAEKTPWKMFFFGIVYASAGAFLAMWIFKEYSSLIMVFLTTMAAIPLIYNTIRMEEKKDLEELSERRLLKEHGKALSYFMWLFFGMVVAGVFWFAVLPSNTVSTLFESQLATIQTLAPTTGNAIQASASTFNFIFLNNVQVLIFCILFSFLYGAGAIFILTWNASVIAAAIGNFIRGGLSVASTAIGADKMGQYFSTVAIGLLKYTIHGIPEILAYFTAGLAGGIISVAVIRHDFGTRSFEHILLDSADLILLSLLLLFVAAILEVFVTPIVF
ncbi:MAG: stage II sporulation protein M [Candidatus Woesearchaeota archaeon]